MSILAGEPSLNRRYHPLAVPIIRASRQQSASRTLSSVFPPMPNHTILKHPPALLSHPSEAHCMGQSNDFASSSAVASLEAILSVLQVGLTSSAIADSCGFQ